MRALRFAGEEVQLGSVLEAVCQDPRVAEAFAAAVVGKSKGGNAPWDRDWLSLLEVAESDGDFDEGIPTLPEVDAQRDLLAAIGPLVFEHLVTELRSKYGHRAEPALRGLRARPVTQDRVWAGFVIRGADGAWLYIAIRNLFADHPRLRIDYYTFDDWRARRRLSDAHARIGKRGFQPVNNYYRFDQPVEQLRGASAADPDDAISVINERLSNLVRTSVFDLEIERLGPRRRRKS